MARTWPFKDPEEVLDYGFDWSPRALDEDLIESTTAEVVTGDVVIDSHGVAEVEGVLTGHGTVTWLSGGTAGTACEINLHAVTAGGRELEQTLKIKIKER
jgi:hypothetical protein